MNIVIREVPPLLMKGSGAPTTGIKPVTIPILKKIYKKIKKETPKIKILLVTFSSFKNSLIKIILITKKIGDVIFIVVGAPRVKLLVLIQHTMEQDRFII